MNVCLKLFIQFGLLCLIGMGILLLFHAYNDRKPWVFIDILLGVPLLAFGLTGWLLSQHWRSSRRDEHRST